jgi:predicted SAM-dependent methyltransferase
VSHETSKALARRLRDPNFANLYFVGRALDIGAGNDSLGKQLAHWPKLVSVDDFDVGDGDASRLLGVKDNSYDLVYSSHCLEHLALPWQALARWRDVLRPGGHLVFTVPDFEMYERGVWPSQFNPDHKTRFTFEHTAYLLSEVPGVIKVERIIEGFDPSLPVTVDQTFDGQAECSIEVIVRKP